MDRPDSMLAGTLRTGRILIGALTFGLVAVSGVMYALVAGGQVSPHAQGDLLLLILAVLWPATAGMSVFMGRTLTQQARAEWQQSGAGDEDALAPRFLVLNILRGALLEGSGLFGAVAFMLTGEPAALLAPVLSAGLLLGMVYPTRERFESFVRAVTNQGP
jgi:hypothetical protein